MTAVEPVYFKLGPAIARARRALGLRQRQLAEQVGLTRASIANIEACRQRVTLDTFIRLRDVLAFDAAEVLGPAPPAPPARVVRHKLETLQTRIERHTARQRERLGL